MIDDEVYLLLGIRRGGPDRQPGREARGQHADERIREPDLQIFRSFGHLNIESSNVVIVIHTNDNNNNNNNHDDDHDDDVTKISTRSKWVEII